MSDIICSRAWYCDDCETYHIEHLWAHEDGTYTTCDSDGNHEPFEHEGDLETEIEAYCKEAEESWTEYAEHCAETGDDSLGEYYVKRTITKKENWVIWFTDWIGREEHGYAVIDGRHGKIRPKRSDIKYPQDFSKELSDFLCLKKVGDRYCMQGVTLEDIRNEAGYVSNFGPKYYMKLQISYDKPRNARDVAKDVKALAQKQLQTRSA